VPAGRATVASEGSASFSSGRGNTLEFDRFGAAVGRYEEVEQLAAAQ
jgi:hypothetical protein